MPDLVTLLRRLADEYEAEDKLEQTAAQEQAREQRIDQLEQLIKQGATAKVHDALGELSDDEIELIRQRRNGIEVPPVDDREGGDAPDDQGGDVEETEIDARPRQRVSKRDVPKIYTGRDEPDHVEYLDEDGTVKVRPGRKNGVPYELDVQDIEDDDGEDAE